MQNLETEAGELWNAPTPWWEPLECALTSPPRARSRYRQSFQGRRVMSEALRYDPFPKGQPTIPAVHHVTPITDNRPFQLCTMRHR